MGGQDIKYLSFGVIYVLKVTQRCAKKVGLCFLEVTHVCSMRTRVFYKDEVMTKHRYFVALFEAWLSCLSSFGIRNDGSTREKTTRGGRQQRDEKRLGQSID